MKNVLIVGATSGMASACARLWAGRGARLFLVARDAARMQQSAADLQGRGGTVAGTFVLDLNDHGRHGGMLDAAFAALGQVDAVLVAHGTLPDQAACQADAVAAVREFSTNALSTIALLTDLANRMERQRSGAIAVITSVAADRGRPSNYLYGSAKAAVDTFCEGLRARLFKAGVHVATIRPGFVATPMTAGLDLPAALTATPEKVAADILAAVDRRRDVIYTPWFWRGIMLVIKALPRAIFKRKHL